MIRAAPAYALPAAAGVLVAAIAAAAVSHWPAGVFYDDGIYLVLAKSLAAGSVVRLRHTTRDRASKHPPSGGPR